MSDKYLTESCGILQHLIPGDVVLADRGFNISDSVGMMQAKLHIPAFTKGKISSALSKWKKHVPQPMFVFMLNGLLELYAQNIVF